jgi:hypothetical protein
MHASLYASSNTPTLQPVRGLSEAVSVDDTTYERRPGGTKETRLERGMKHTKRALRLILAPFQRLPPVQTLFPRSPVPHCPQPGGGTVPIRHHRHVLHPILLLLLLLLLDLSQSSTTPQCTQSSPFRGPSG